MILKREFYERDPFTVAKQLLGKTLVHETTEGVTSGIIVETEAYLGPEDKASHAYRNLRTKRTETQFGPKGHAYIYLIYGLYHCFNITVGEVPGKPEAVLMRALEPASGVELMLKRRLAPNRKTEDLANGPSKLCMTMSLTIKQNGKDMCVPPFYVTNQGLTVSHGEIVQTTRIGVDYASEWKNMPW